MAAVLLGRCGSLPPRFMAAEVRVSTNLYEPLRSNLPPQPLRHYLKPIERRFQILDNLSRQHIGIGEVIEIRQGFTPHPGDFKKLHVGCFDTT